MIAKFLFHFSETTKEFSFKSPPAMILKGAKGDKIIDIVYDAIRVKE